MNLLLSCMLMTGLLSPAQGAARKDNPAPAKEEYSVELYLPVQGDAKQPATLDQAITQALANHPDMRLAEAELRVAEAKLVQARIAVSQKVTEDFHRLEKERADVELAKANWDRMTQLLKSSAISQEEYRVAQNQLASAKARLAATESSWKLMMGAKAAGAGGPLNNFNARYDIHPVDKSRVDFSTWSRLYNQQVSPVYEVFIPVPSQNTAGSSEGVDQLKAKLGMRIKLDKQPRLNLEQAFQKLTESANLKVRIKLPITENKTLYKEVTQVELEAGDYPLRTWLQLIVDEMNNQQALTSQQWKEAPKRYELYVREYGLLLTSRDLAPPDAITVQELWKQFQFEKAAEAKKAPESAPAKK